MRFEKIPERISAKFRQLLRYYSCTKSTAKLNPNSKTAVVNLGRYLLNKDSGRYSFIICQILKFSGFEVVVKLDPEFFYTEAPYKKMLLAQDFTKIRNTSLNTGSIELRGSDLKKKTIKLFYGYGLIRNRIKAYYLPYTLHPRFYQKYTDNTNFNVFREGERMLRVIFAGNFERSLYDNSILKEDFEGTISRVEVLDHIAAKYSKDSRIVYSSTKEDLYDLLNTKSMVQNFMISKVRTPDEDWLSILSKGDFYLCLPGVRMPWSHNALETMAVGTIPILQYNDFFYPPLVHLENCIAFDSFDSLDKAIEIALNMKEEEVASMRQRVIRYYNEYLSTGQTIKKLQTFFASEEETMSVAIPFLNGK
jgi:hypothetical protein